jgi:hypothetical protein
MEKYARKNSRLGIIRSCFLGAFVLWTMTSVRAQEQDATSLLQNAVVEGVQISAEAGGEQGEKLVTCYFIFKDKPTSYFYEIKKKSKKLIFEFNDTQKGTSPIASAAEPPLIGFEIEQKKVDVNKEVKGLNQEWHDLISISFDLTKIPRIDVKDEYNVISFSYKWTTDPGKEKDYEIREDSRSKVVVLGSVGAGGLIAGGILWYFLTQKSPAGSDGPLPINDLPAHINSNK